MTFGLSAAATAALAVGAGGIVQPLSVAMLCSPLHKHRLTRHNRASMRK